MALLREPGAAAEAAVELWLAGAGLGKTLTGAVGYAVLGPGKRLRPGLVWYAAGACGGGDGDGNADGCTFGATAKRGELLGAVGAAVEMVHAFSLVHDDLPCLDDDDVRRGRPTLHRHVGEPLALLAGDALATGPYRLLSDQAPAELAVALMRELAEGTLGMIRGQVHDTLAGSAEADDPGADAVQRLEATHRGKTGALVRACCRMGGLCGGADEATLGALTRYGEAVGLAFQVVDDLLDVEGDAATAGKAVGKDAAAGKRTYPALLGVDGARRRADELRAEAEAALEPLGTAAGALSRLAGLLTDRRR